MKILKIVRIIFIIIALWVACTTMIYALNNPKKTNTELLLHIPKSFIFNFR